MKTLHIYTLQDCIYCNELKGELNKLNIHYQETIVDDGHIIASKIGYGLEKHYKTETYPIVELYSPLGTRLMSFITKTELNETNPIFIYENIDQIINKLKQLYAL